MTAVRLPKPSNGLPASKEMDDIDPGAQINLNSVEPDSEKGARHRKKKKKHRDDRKRKRSLSWSTESSECSNVSKRKKKKKKHRRNKSPPSPRVNPIFLWVKQDNTKIVEVLCEDYDKRNRIKLTKTALGWRAIPRTERLSRQSSDSLVNSQSSHDTKDNYESDESLTTFEHSEGSVCHDVDKNVGQNDAQDLDADVTSNTNGVVHEPETSGNNRAELIKLPEEAGNQREESVASCENNDTPEEKDEHTNRNKISNEIEDVDNLSHNNGDSELTFNVHQEVTDPEELPNVEETDFKSNDIPDNFEDCNFSDSSSIPPENGHDSVENNSPLQAVDNLKYNTETKAATNQQQTVTVPEIDVYEFRDDDEEEENTVNKDSYYMPTERAMYELILGEQNRGETDFINEEGDKEFDEQRSLPNFRECENSQQHVQEEIPQHSEDPQCERDNNLGNNEAEITDKLSVLNEDIMEQNETKNEVIQECNNEENVNNFQEDNAYQEDIISEKEPVDIPELTSTDHQNSEIVENIENSDSIKEVSEESSVKVEPQDSEVVPEVTLNETNQGEDCKLALDKCCEGGAAAGEAGLDENHNNEMDNEPVRHNNCLLDEGSNFCGEVDECVEKTLGDLIGELEERAMNRASRMSGNNPDSDHAKDEHLNDNGFLGPNCTDLMDELEEMCHGIMNERLKNFDAGSKSDLSDIYNYVPTSVEEEQEDEEEVADNSVNEIKPTICEATIKDDKIVDNVVETKAESPINLVMQEKVTDEMLKLKSDSTQLKNCELESLDLLWRLPEGTTIHHSKVPLSSEEVRPAHLQSAKGNPLLNIPKPNSYKTYVPEQIEPLNLGKPKPKEEPIKDKKPLYIPPKVHKTEDVASINIKHNQHKHVKTDKHSNDNSSKLLELLTSEEKVDPLAQLKEVLSDPDLAVPDPLLVPRERLSALIANPAKEIPRLLAQKQEIKYPKFDTDLLVVSLTHLQMMLQTTGKDEDMRFYQQHAQMLQSQLNTGKECSLDPATASMINQMLWLPYLEQLQLARTTNPQELLAMLNNVVAYPPYPQWTQQGYEYAQQQQMLSLWQDMMQKPNLSAPPSLSKSYNDLYKSSSQSGVLPGYGQVRPNKAPPAQLGSTAAGAASRSSYNSRPADISYSSSRRQSKSSRHHHHHHNNGINNYVQRQQSWPMSQCNLMPPTNDPSHRLPQTSTGSSHYATHSSSTSSRISSHPSMISGGAGSGVGGGGGASSTISTSSSSGIIPGKHHNIHDVAMVSTASSTTTTSASSLPKLKVRDFGIDPSRRPNNLLKFGEPHFAHHPGAKFHDANHSNLWHPLFSSLKRFLY
uniref:Uncharacterized protein n=1 Tax=Rhodnius prolixus TaxID=13249 RepID=T1H9A0_RHOPR